MMICPNGCTDDNDTPIEMEFDFRGHGRSAEPGYRCTNPDCGYFERQSERGRL